MADRRIVVTGATGGIGEAIALRAAKDGASVVLVGRSAERLKASMRMIGAAVSGADLTAERADLSLTSEVRSLAERIAEGPRPDAVVSNAAVIAGLRERTTEGVQLTLAVNHLAPYLLLRTLADHADRMVVVGADPGVLARIPVDLDDLQFTRRWRLGPLPSARPFVAYGKTKNMNAMFVYALDRRLRDRGRTTAVNGAHPGIIAGTRLGRHTWGTLRAVTAVADRFTASPGPEAGADTPLWLATDPGTGAVSGRFFVERSPVATAPHTTDRIRCDRLWEESARMVGLPAD